VQPNAGVAYKDEAMKWAVKCMRCRNTAAPISKPKAMIDLSLPRVVADLDVDPAAPCKFEIVNITDANQWQLARDMLKGTAQNKSIYRCTIVVGEAICKRFEVANTIKIDVSPALGARLQVLRSQSAAASAVASQFVIDAEKRLANIGKALFPFQRSGVAWLAAQKSAILGDEMGLGKTVQALVAAPPNAAMLVIGPASAKGVWPAECALWRPDLKPIVIEGKGKFRWPARGELIFITYGCLPQPSETCDRCNATRKNQRAPDCSCEDIPPAPLGINLISDEYHNVKKPTTQRTLAFRGLVRRTFASGGQVWALTGTPLDNKLDELFTLADNIGRGKQAFGSRAEFDRMFRARQTKFGIRYSAIHIDPQWIGNRLREFFMRRLKVDVMPDLPAKTVEIRSVDIDRASRNEIDQVVAELAKAGVDLEATIRAVRGKADDSDRGSLFRLRSILAMAKVAAALEIIQEFEDAGEPLIVFSSHRAPVQLIGKRKGWAMILGDTDGAERGRLSRDEFQKGKLKGIAGTIAAMGEGLTLTRSNTVLIIDPDFRVGKNLQAEDRSYRIGQTRSVRIIYLKANHQIDDQVFKALAIKRQTIARTVDSATSNAEGKAS
jgi:SNF2 family DNA or RNA helicase